MFAVIPVTAGVKYVDRDPPENADFDETNLNVKQVWTDIDLSSIVPVGIKLVLLAVKIVTVEANGTINLRKKGVTYFYEGDGITNHAVNQDTLGNIQISCDSNRKIQYHLNDVTWTAIYISIKGWFV